MILDRLQASIRPVHLVAGCLLGVVALFYLQPAFLELLELRTYDLRMRSRGPIAPSDAVVMALIDEQSLDVEGRWPWPRSRMAALVDRLSEAGARVIAFDVGFLEPDENSNVELLQGLEHSLADLEIRDARLDRLLDGWKRESDTDRALVEAIERSSASVVLGYFFHALRAEGDEGYRIAPEEIDRQLELIEASQYASVLFREPVATSPFEVAYAPEGNLPELARAADSSGTFTIQQDEDGIVRWMPLALECGPLEEVFPPLSVLAAWHYLGEPPMTLHVGPAGVEGVELGERFVPTGEKGRLLVNFLGPPRSVPHFSVGDLLVGKVSEERIRDRIVLVGATATGTYDMRSTPFSTVFPGVEIHASVIENILSNDYITRPAWSEIYDLLAIVVMVLVAGLALPRLGASTAALLAVALFGLHVVVARQFFVELGVWLNVVYPLLALVATYTTLTIHAYLKEERERKQVQGAFGQYVAPVIIEQMLQDPSKLKLGGEEKVLSVLFSDLQGFTAYSERFSPAEMTSFLSDYYGRMTEQVFEAGGMLKEYVGDELMAIFGAPLDQEDHAIRACRAALAMQRKRHQMSEEWQATGRPALVARTGVNSGRMLVGNLGSEYRFSYGVMGDDVNLGSRLEGLNKQYGSEIIIGENTAELVGDTFVLRELDQVRVVGKQKPTRIYELLGEAAEGLAAEHEKAIRAYRDGLQAYRAQHWQEALALFGECEAHWPEDRVARTMMGRCQEYAAEPPREDWDGVYEATKK
ncbi:MAG: adenylate/guanylate cyclase domain-containing protein [Deltaproteobacteria bacterium]|nr:adenylate/guanylate cyclase domain-containing protein [Deltaproteobacteria bacterium]